MTDKCTSREEWVNVFQSQDAVYKVLEVVSKTDLHGSTARKTKHIDRVKVLTVLYALALHALSYFPWNK